MRRSVPFSLRKIADPPALSSDGDFALDVRLPLQCITPVIGGGVESRTPDPGEAVRVPALRGALRTMWRAVTALDPRRDNVFQREAALFGGVGTGQETGRGPDAQRSRVVLSVTVDSEGRIEPAGRHLRGGDGSFKALPQWDLGRDLGYALFPLQRSDAERRQPAPPGQRDLPTHPVRHDLRFTLRVQLRAQAQGRARDESDAEEVLQALCALVHFGGVGGRTSRGFGALALQDGALVEGLGPWDETWQRRFAPPDHDRLGAWLGELGLGAAAGQAAPPWPSLRHAQVLVGPLDRSMRDAHERLIDMLRQFRQGPGVGREQGRIKREGVSRWPEGWVLRALHEADHRGVTRWEHPPEPVLVEIARRERDTLRLPRAAFGLPILVQFKDRGDKAANALLEGDGDELNGARFASPLWLRPLRCQQGPAALAILYPNRPQRVSVRFIGKKQKEREPFAVQGRVRGAREPILGWLEKDRGDAAAAFLSYLLTQRFARVGGRGA